MATKKVNESGLRALGRAVLLRPYEPEFAASKIVIPETVAARTKMVETRAVVIDIGPEAWIDESQPRAEVGDKVMVSKYTGAIVIGPADGKAYRMVNDRDIYARIERELDVPREKKDLDEPVEESLEETENG